MFDWKKIMNREKLHISQINEEILIKVLEFKKKHSMFD